MNHFKVKSKSSPPTLLMRSRPDGNEDFAAFAAPGESFGAYVHCDALAFIAAAAREASPNETMGLLAGRVCYDPQTGPYTLVMCADVALPGELDANPGYVHISAEGHARVRRRLEELNHDREVVGWFHSHPTHEARFSPVDEHEQATWTDPNYLGIVFSGTDSSEPFGVYRGPRSVLLQQNGPLPSSFIQERLSRPTFAKKAAVTATPHETPSPHPSTKQNVPLRSAPETKLSVGATRDTTNRPELKYPHLPKDRGAALLWIIALLTAAALAGVIWVLGRVRALERKVEATGATPAATAPPPATPGAFMTPLPHPLSTGEAVGRPSGEVSTKSTLSSLDDNQPAAPVKSLAPMPSAARTTRTPAAVKRASPPPKKDSVASGKKNSNTSPKKGAEATQEKKDKDAESPKKKEDKLAPKED